MKAFLYLENPQEGQNIANLDVFDDVGTQSYRALKDGAKTLTSYLNRAAFDSG